VGRAVSQENIKLMQPSMYVRRFWIQKKKQDWMNWSSRDGKKWCWGFRDWKEIYFRVLFEQLLALPKYICKFETFIWKSYILYIHIWINMYHVFIYVCIYTYNICIYVKCTLEYILVYEIFCYVNCVSWVQC